MIRARQKDCFVLVITTTVMFKVLYLVCVREREERGDGRESEKERGRRREKKETRESLSLDN